MATIAMTKRLAWSSGSAQIIFSGTDSITQAGEQAIENVQIIGATSEAILFGDVTTPGWVGFKNMNATAGADIYIASASPAVADATSQFKLAPGRSVLIETTIAAWYAISSSGSSNLLVCAIEA